MRQLAQRAVETAKIKGATYADCRVIFTKNESITVQNGKVGSLIIAEDIGFGVRVIVDGAWGYACSPNVTVDEVDKVAAQAVQIARASAMLKKEDVRLAPEPIVEAQWLTPIVEDPFSVPLEEKLKLLFDIDKILCADDRIKNAESSMAFKSEHQWMATSEGSFIDQLLIRSGSGYSATAVGGGEVQVRSYPNSFRGQYMSLGYELVRGLGLLDNAERVREEAIELLTAPTCPSGKRDTIIDGSMLGLQIHESVGHATELDRVLGMEANYAGMSFVTTEKLNNFRYGSDHVNLVCDSTIPGGLATIGWDDDAVRAQRWHIVQNGQFVGYQFSRELAHKINADRSSGNNRAQGWGHIPIVRITNLSLMPGKWKLDDLMADTEGGIYMETNKSWSIDQWRLNFQFGVEAAWEIKGGKKGRLLKNANYQGITPEFWGSCDAVCNQNHWTLWGVHNCGKGQPGQTAEMSHGAAPSRFRDLTVGVGN
ncbi:MAG: TldD/PmbA family protein [Candidatus Electryoneaceae bacterium]|nr:TldD/PmbA family protein [Candidatus Electryoneaceae bacterium]